MQENDHLDLYGVHNSDEESEAAIELVKAVKKELRPSRRQHEKDWRTFEDAYYGKQHKTGGDRKSVKNHIFKIVEGEVPILTDSMPGTQILAQQADREDDAKNLERAIKYVYQQQNLALLMPTAVRNALISAPGFIYSWYDPDADDGDGAIKMRILDWRSVLLDGNATTIEDAQKAQICIPMRRSELQRLWPEKAKELKGVNGNIDLADEDDELDGREDRDTSDERVNEMGRPKNHKAKDIINYTETWVKSYALVAIPPEETAAEIEKEGQQLLQGEAPDIKKWEDHNAHMAGHQQLADQQLAQMGLPPGTPFEAAQQAVHGLIEQAAAQDPAAGEAMSAQVGQALLALRITLNHIEEHAELAKLNPTGQTPKYEDGWRVIKSAGDCVLYDAGNPEPGMDIPLTPVYCYKDGTIWGFGEVKNIHNAQMTLNDVDYKEFKGLKLNANPGWIYDLESEIDESKLTNQDGIVIGRKRGTDVSRLPPGQISPQLAERRQSDQVAMEDISGINETSQGNMPTGGASGVAISRLQTQAIGRIRLKDRYLQHYSMKRLAKITGVLIINHWSDEKRLRMRTDDNEIEDFIFDPIRMQDLDYTVEIAPGSMAGVNRDSLNEFFKGLLDAQQITMLEFLAVADFPKREILIDLVRQREDTQMQMQQMQRELVQFKSLSAPSLLTPDEQAVLQAIQQEEMQKQILSGQAIDPALLGQPMTGAAEGPKQKVE